MSVGGLLELTEKGRVANISVQIRNQGRWRLNLKIASILIALIAVTAQGVQTQPALKPSDSLPSSFRTVENYFKLPAGRAWGAISAIEVDKDGQSIWIAERCGGNSGCPANPSVAPVLLFDASGKLVRSFGAGMIL